MTLYGRFSNRVVVSVGHPNEVADHQSLGIALSRCRSEGFCRSVTLSPTGRACAPWSSSWAGLIPEPRWRRLDFAFMFRILIRAWILLWVIIKLHFPRAPISMLAVRSRRHSVYEPRTERSNNIESGGAGATQGAGKLSSMRLMAEVLLNYDLLPSKISLVKLSVVAFLAQALCSCFV